MGLMSDEILGGGGGDNGTNISRYGVNTNKGPTRTQSLNRKSYLFSSKEKQSLKGGSQHRRDAIKSSLFKALDQDDTSTTYDVVSDDDGEFSCTAVGSTLKRASSLDNGAVKKSSQPKLRGKKIDLVGNKKHTSSGSPSTERRPTRQRPSPSDNSLSTRKTRPSNGTNINSKATTLPNRSRRERSKSDTSSLVPNKSRQDAEVANVPPPRPIRRKSSMGFLVGSFSKQSEEEDRSKVQQEVPTRRVAKRSMSLGWEKKPAQSTEPGALGAFLSSKHPKDASDSDDDESSDGGNSATSGTSWITWAASAAVSSALKPLERLYDDINDKGTRRDRARDDDGDASDDEREFPNTEAEAYSATKLSTTEKIAGLRFVASRQRRQSLYM